jgi:hypothetical protein
MQLVWGFWGASQFEAKRILALKFLNFNKLGGVPMLCRGGKWIFKEFCWFRI